MFELTYKCHFSCRHCYVPYGYRRKKELPTQRVFSILDELKNIGCFYLGFTGGEPFVRKDLVKILTHAKRCGFQVMVYTNGYFIDRNKADALANLALNKVDITLPGMSAAVFDRVTGIQGSRAKVFNAIRLLYKRKVPLALKTCVLKENAHEIKAIQDFSASLGAMHRLDDRLLRRLDGSDEPLRLRGALHCKENRGQRAEDRGQKTEDGGQRTEDRKGIENKSFNIQPRTPHHHPLFQCGVGKTQVAITPQGELKPCLMIDEPRFVISEDRGKSKEGSGKWEEGRGKREGDVGLKKAWEQLKEFVGSIKPDENYQCEDCDDRVLCKWCPAQSWLFNRSFTSCDCRKR